VHTCLPYRFPVSHVPSSFWPSRLQSLPLSRAVFVVQMSLYWLTNHKMIKWGYVSLIYDLTLHIVYLFSPFLGCGIKLIFELSSWCILLRIRFFDRIKRPWPVFLSHIRITQHFTTRARACFNDSPMINLNIQNGANDVLWTFNLLIYSSICRTKHSKRMWKLLFLTFRVHVVRE
jgi:hypothetical protein